MQDRGPAKDSPEDAKVSAESPTIAAATPVPALQAGTPVRSRPKPVEDWTGREVAGRYTVLERLGEGGMGVVYVAEHLHLKKKVAFKVILPHLAAHEDLLLRFKREALATGQLDHPHIASAIDFGELEDGGAFMVMPWVRGQSLQDALESDEPMDFKRAANLCAQIADALSAAHEMGIVHRDLKPDNVLVEVRSDGSESAKVLDFGVASLAGQPEGLRSVEARPLTQAGTILGTPGYMSPEQASAGEVDHRTDLYALGVMLWELCKGERLFEGTDITAIFAKQFNSVPPPLNLGRSSKARELSELVTKLLSWDKNQRPSTAAEVRDTLRRIVDQPDTDSPLELGLEWLRATVQRGMAAIPPAYRGYVPHAIGALALLLAVLIVAFDDTKEAAQEPPVATSAAPDAKSAKNEKAKAEKSEPTKPAAKREEKAEVAPAREEKPPEAKPAEQQAAAGGTQTRSAPSLQLSGDEATLFTAKARESRRSAAKRILAEADKHPAWVTAVAKLESATTCSARRGALEDMRKLGDPRVLGVLYRLDDQPRRGCGLLRLSDCLSCVRKDIEDSIAALER